MKQDERQQLDRVRERFTRTASQFARFALAQRAEEADRLAQLSVAGFARAAEARAMDLACGPGTFARALAGRVRFVLGVDLTPAMLGEALQVAARAGLRNVGFTCGDANALPFADATLDLATCGYSLHQFCDPGRAVREMARVVRRGGRVAVADLILPEGAGSTVNTRIERARDPSHARTLPLAELAAMLETAGLRVLAREVGERDRRFSDWMATAGREPGSPSYVETLRGLEATLAGDAAGFHPRWAAVEDGARQELWFVQTTAFVVAEKP